MTRHFLEIDDLSAADLTTVLDLSEVPIGRLPKVLAGQGTALLFEKPSARTRNSTEMAVVQLGGHPVTIRGEEVGLDTRETVEDVTRTLACYHSAIAARGCSSTRSSSGWLQCRPCQWSTCCPTAPIRCRHWRTSSRSGRPSVGCRVARSRTSATGTTSLAHSRSRHPWSG